MTSQHIHFTLNVMVCRDYYIQILADALRS